MSNMAEGVCMVRVDDETIVYANRTFARIMGYGPGELEGKPVTIIHPPELGLEDEGSAEQIITTLKGGDTARFEAHNIRKDGTHIWCRGTTSNFEHPEHGKVWVAVQSDITEERAAREALREAEERFRRAFEDSASGMALIEGRGPEAGRFREVNEALSLMSGYRPAELLGMSYWDLVHPDEVEAMRRGVGELVAGRVTSFQAELRMIGAAETVKWIAFNVSLVRDGEGVPLSAVVQAQDVSERKRFESELQYLADHDSLTGLYNRRRFAAELQREIAGAERYQTGGAILVLDLDHFKLVNDSLGHAAGDELLATVAKAVEGRLRTSDVIGRLGGDEFGIILPHADQARAILVAESLREVVRTVAAAQPGVAQVTASVGIVTLGTAGHERGGERLVSDADAAMYAAKQAGRDRVRVYAEGETRAALRIA
jgi:diguanylate cyclase (GGDEF)-like protein/PAS domain S-box-containing protein